MRSVKGKVVKSLASHLYIIDMAKKYFQFPLTRGIHSKQAHVDVPEGTFEEELGREGFFGPATHIYRKNPPTDWVSIEGDCRPQAFDANNLGSPLSQRLLFNRHCTLSLAKGQGADPLFSRNADGDEVHFIHEGEGILESDFGHLPFKKGDYVYIPRASTYRFYAQGAFTRFVIEAKNSVFCQPERGILGHHALYDPAVLEIPELQESKAGPTDSSKGLWQIQIKRNDKMTLLSYARNPLDTVGLKGDTTVFKLSIHDIRPIMSHRAHLAPSVHSTFVTDRFVVCSFVPRPLEEDKGAQRVPFFHRNVDYDEVLFYHAGDFFSRDNIRPGWLTFHPTGVHHGPHPKALANQFKKTHTDEYAVMIDTRDPLEVDPQFAKLCEFKDYVNSWKPKP